MGRTEDKLVTQVKEKEGLVGEEEVMGKKGGGSEIRVQGLSEGKKDIGEERTEGVV